MEGARGEADSVAGDGIWGLANVLWRIYAKVGQTRRLVITLFGSEHTWAEDCLEGLFY